MVGPLQFCAWLLLPAWLYAFGKADDKNDVTDNIIACAIVAVMFCGALFCIIMAVKTIGVP